MTDIQSIKHKDISICIFENKYSSDELLKFFNKPELYKNELEQISGEKRRKEYLGLRFALKECLDNKEHKIIYSHEGKPMLENGKFNISFSHAGNWNAAVSHPTKKVGTDIEIPSEKLRRVYEKFLSTQEQQDFPKICDLETLCLLWSSKEVLFKIIGNEAVDFAKQLQIFPFEKKERGEIKAKHLVSGKNYTLNYRITPNYVIVFGIEE
ncbi:4'-phosphopantetheinyl transferase [uncultured Paludibacter sp.]|nr:4'-phosphopantetheinyl transferase [uncultured Paludibacter sp.]